MSFIYVYWFETKPQHKIHKIDRSPLICFLFYKEKMV